MQLADVGKKPKKAIGWQYWGTSEEGAPIVKEQVAKEWKEEKARRNAQDNKGNTLAFRNNVSGRPYLSGTFG
jgi:hypothetical protein